MRESRSSGSVEGVVCKHDSYSDCNPSCAYFAGDLPLESSDEGGALGVVNRPRKAGAIHPSIPHRGIEGFTQRACKSHARRVGAKARGAPTNTTDFGQPFEVQLSKSFRPLSPISVLHPSSGTAVFSSRECYRGTGAKNMRRLQKARDDRPAADVYSRHEARITSHESGIATTKPRITNHQSLLTDHHSQITQFLIGRTAIKNRCNQMKTKGRLPF